MPSRLKVLKPQRANDTAAADAAPACHGRRRALATI
ncbi:NitT family ABC transporter periplasmic protein, partial [Cupriavidus sp. HMR-1]